MRDIPKAGELYKHFKGNCYRVLTIATHSETGEQLVIYQALYGEYGCYARELSMFMSEVDRNKYPEVAQKYRFELLAAPGTAQVVQVESPAPAMPAMVQETVPQEGDVEEAVAQTDEQDAISPKLLAFLDAETMAEKLSVLDSMKGDVTDSMITTMAYASDVEVPEGDLQERFRQLYYCIETKQKFECTRLRN